MSWEHGILLLEHSLTARVLVLSDPACLLQEDKVVFGVTAA